MSVGFVLVSLVAMGQDVSLAGAVERGNKEAVRSLLSQQVDVNESQGDGATALHWAVYLNDADTTALLIGAGARVDQPNSYGATALALAAKNGNASIVTQLIEAGADPNRGNTSNGWTPLHAACGGLAWQHYSYSVRL